MTEIGIDLSTPRTCRFWRLIAWARRHNIARRLAVALTIAALASGVATYIALTGSPPFSSRSTLLTLIIIDLVLLLPLAAFTGIYLLRLWSERRRRSAGSRLQARLVFLFSVIAIVPAIIIVIFTALFFNFGIQSWFSERVGTALSESLSITDRYLAEKQLAIEEKVKNVRDDINRYTLAISISPRRFRLFASRQLEDHGIRDAAIFDKRGRVLLAVGTGTLLPYEQQGRIQAALAALSKRDVAIISTAGSTNLRAITRLQVFFDSPLYLYVATSIEPALVNHINRLRGAVAQYLRLKDRRSTLEIGFFLLFAIVALLLLFAAIWLGLMFADRLARPIIDLINAADRVGGGDYQARVPEGDANDEVTSLSRAFNRMTSQLDRNRRELIEANQQIDARRQFTETVLAGVSAGVIGLDVDGRINLPNRSASELLATDLDANIGDPLERVVPEMGDMLARVLAHPRRPQRAEISVERDGKLHTLLVRMASEMLSEEVVGFVVTFDDITELQTAQRLAAWADVARRIAHEIKNPLTPIQLSAERLRRKYLHQIQTDPEAFEICTDTIVRQVGDIERLVDEFSDFARMPSPKMAVVDLRDICRQAVFLQREGFQTIDIQTDLPDQPVMATCDRRQISQALTNLLKNASEAISEAGGENGEGRIEVTLKVENDQPLLVVEDNGTGMPQDLLPRLTEPYVTTRAKGTGLGLAIVRKIMEDHAGSLSLRNRAAGGASATLTFRAEDSPESTIVPEQAAE